MIILTEDQQEDIYRMVEWFLEVYPESARKDDIIYGIVFDLTEYLANGSKLWEEYEDSDSNG